MELPGSGLFYALAALGMAFAGFTAIVVVMRQATGKQLSPLHVFFTSAYAELGLMSTTFAMVAPLLALCGLEEKLLWQVSSAFVVAMLAPWLLAYPRRRKIAAPKEKIPFRWHVMFSVGLAVVATLILNITGAAFRPGPGPIAVASVYVLAIASVIFLRNYASYFRD